MRAQVLSRSVVSRGVAMALTVAMVMVAGCVVEEEDGPNRGNNNNNNTGGGSNLTGWYTNNPTAANYNISTAAQLEGLAELVNGGNNFDGKTITLTADINLSSYNASNTAFNNGRGWIPIGNGSNNNRRFAGTFNGNGKVVRGLFINNNTGSHFGLFGHLRGMVKDLGIEDANINGNSHVGAVAGQIDNNGMIMDCYSTGMVRASGSYLGGIVGLISGGSNVTYCHSTATVSGTGSVGGIAGRNHGSVENTYFIGSVSGTNNVGGVVGEKLGGSVTTSYSKGSVNGTIAIGGVVGRNATNSGNIANCYSTSTVSGDENTGGVVGYHTTGRVANCYSTGVVNGGSYVGGIVGYNSNVTMMMNAALNSSLNGSTNVSRVAARSLSNLSNLSGSVAFADMKRNDEETVWPNIGAGNLNGADITLEEILADPTMGDRFTEINGWTIVPGYLPGLFGVPEEIPAHLW